MLPHYGYSVAKAKLTDPDVVSHKGKALDCLEGKHSIGPVGSLLML